MFLFLDRFESGESAYVLVAIRILHFVIRREQDLTKGGTTHFEEFSNTHTHF